MKVKTCKDFSLVALLAAILFAAIPTTRCDENLGRANFTQSSDIRTPSGLLRLKPLATGQQNPPGVLSDEQRKSPLAPSASASSSSTSSKDLASSSLEEKFAGNPVNSHHDTSHMEVDDAESSKKVNKNLESRSNSSSLDAGIISSKHPLFTEHHNRNFPGGDLHDHKTGVAGSSEEHDSKAEESSLHEHVEKYHLHQSSEDDSDEEVAAPFGNPQFNHRPAKTSSEEDNHAHSIQKLPSSVVVNSESFPVRPVSGGPRPISGIGIRGNNGFSSNRTVGSSAPRKPIPVIRHEESLSSANVDENHNN